MPDQKTTVTTPAAVKPPDTPKPTVSKTPLPSVPAPPVEKKPQEPKAPEKNPPVAGNKATEPGKTDQKPQAEHISPKKPEQPGKSAPEAKTTTAAEKKPETAAPAVPKPASSPEKKPETPKAEKAENPTEPPQAAKGPAPLGVHITRIFDDRLDKPDEKALQALPVPQEGEGFSMRLHPDYFFDFLDHPFSVNREVQDYKDLFESIKATGINEPVKARPREGGGLELISGHRRHDIAQAARVPSAGGHRPGGRGHRPHRGGGRQPPPPGTSPPPSWPAPPR